MAQNHVTIEGSSDAAPPPDLSSLMITAMALGAAHSHVSQTTREEKSNDNPNKTVVTTSTCVSFNFYTPSIPSPYANMHIQANVLPSSPISIATTDLADALSEEGFPVLDDDPCNSVNLPFASTTPPDTSHVASTPAASHAGISSMTPAAAANVSALATINNSSAVDDSIPNHVDAATVSTANNSIADPADATASPVSAAAVLIPVVASQRWYCITIGKQVGVFQGIQNVTVHISGVSGACADRHPSQASAQAAFADALAKGNVHVRV